MKKLVIVLLLIISTISTAQEKVLLRLHYDKGDSYVMDMKMTQNMGAGIMSMNMAIIMDQKITSVAENEYESDIKIKKMKMDMSQGGIQMSYDSSKKEEELNETEKIMQAKMSPMLQAVITTKTNNLGKVLETKVTPNIPETADLANQPSSVIYPEYKLGVGDSWTMEKENNGMKFNFIYKVTSITNKNVLLNVSGKVNGIAVGNINGNMDIDKKSGVPITSKIAMDMKVEEQDFKTDIIINMIKQ
ncbi:hypothetical protein [Tenacibaculum sp. IB213877]|uniref:hypothetical protein n=1 Tax=Tenacibaculum sp. IB213877 TaxID=3097351 RepID=UPI002A59CEC9|nr:hypothetical protein [Tenacibaculum sp. IB213877]MDY0779785.1 hypothetical protein [Tenacibaculum sp. IB213877]